MIQDGKNEVEPAYIDVGRGETRATAESLRQWAPEA